MEHSSPSRSDESSTCSSGMLDCFTAEKRERNAHKRASRRIGMSGKLQDKRYELTRLGIERPMHVTYNQPHLVEPMKLTVYEDLPATPASIPQSQISKLASQSRRSMSRASIRASMSVRRIAHSRISISKPLPVVPANVLPLRRNPSFRPLQLSIYMPEQRLSDLPEFDRLSFTDEGVIKAPPRALIRTHSEDMLRLRSTVLPEAMSGKPASMFEHSLSRRMSHARKDTDSTIISISRPPSEYDALRSHPVSWYSMPGLPPQIQMVNAPNNSRKILSPMQEEFSPPSSAAVYINGNILTLPDVDAARVQTEQDHRSLLPPAHGQESESACPSPTIGPGPNRRTTIVSKHKSKLSQAASILLDSSANLTRARANTSASLTQPLIGAATAPASTATRSPAEQPRQYFHTNYTTNSRINQWLAVEQSRPLRQARSTELSAHVPRSRNSSISTVESAITTSAISSFTEHRRKRSEFYQLNNKPSVAVANIPVATTRSSTDGLLTKAHRPPAPLKLHKPLPTQTAIAGTNNAQLPASRLPVINTSINTHTHSPSKSSTSTKNPTGIHSRTMTSSTVISTVATEAFSEDPETPDSAHALPIEPHTEAMKSITSTKQLPIVEVVELPKCLDQETNMENGARVHGFEFGCHKPSPLTPRTQCADVEKMMFEMCAQSGLRRVNVGIAF